MGKSVSSHKENWFQLHAGDIVGSESCQCKWTGSDRMPPSAEHRFRHQPRWKSGIRLLTVLEACCHFQSSGPAVTICYRLPYIKKGPCEMCWTNRYSLLEDCSMWLHFLSHSLEQHSVSQFPTYFPALIFLWFIYLFRLSTLSWSGWLWIQSLCWDTSSMLVLAC